MRPTAYKTIRMSNLDAFSHPVDIRTAGSLNNGSALKAAPLFRSRNGSPTLKSIVVPELRRPFLSSLFHQGGANSHCPQAGEWRCTSFAPSLGPVTWADFVRPLRPPDSRHDSALPYCGAIDRPRSAACRIGLIHSPERLMPNLSLHRMAARRTPAWQCETARGGPPPVS